jgi:hypothetical protein
MSGGREPRRQSEIRAGVVDRGVSVKLQAAGGYFSVEDSRNRSNLTLRSDVLVRAGANGTGAPRSRPQAESNVSLLFRGHEPKLFQHRGHVPIVNLALNLSALELIDRNTSQIHLFVRSRHSG